MNWLVINEPITVATNYLLAAACAWFAYSLYRVYRDGSQISVVLWTLAFSFTALASLAGGTFHGLAPLIHEVASIILWKITVFSIGLAAFTMLSGTIIATVSDPFRTFFLILTLAKFLAYAAWMVNHNLFIYVIYDYGFAMLWILLLQFYAYYHDQDRKAKWIIAGVLVSCLGAAVQQSGISFEKFNHNDIYHLIQLVGLILFYIGARQLKDRNV